MKKRLRGLYCCGCNTDVIARLTDGKEVYGHRRDLFSLPFWKCDGCNNFVGCHHKTGDRERPLGCIPTKKIKAMRMAIHKLIDPLWKEKIVSRTQLYRMISDAVGWEYHTAKIKSDDEAQAVYSAVYKIKRELTSEQN